MRAPRLFLLVTVLVFSPAAYAPAGQVVFEKDYTYRASEADSKLSCRAIAVEQVKRLLLEQVGTFVQAETVVKDFRLDKDQVVSMTAGIVSVEILSEHWDGERYALTARVAVDPKQVAEALDNLRGNAVERAELDETRKQNEASLREIERLRKELAALRQGADRPADVKQKEEEYTRTAAGIGLNNLLEKGKALLELGENEKALETFEEAVRLDPKSKHAYLGRGAACARLDRSEQALRDLDKALALDPKFAKVYVVRGRVYRKLGKARESVTQLDKAIELNPEFAQAYFERGLSYFKLREKDSGLGDLRRSAGMGYKKARDVLMERGYLH
jgi:tetratricopeptide (TPR) repeat protein